ncbi:DUF309 domain-containing protein [Rummeliibacillus sp. NPDC094406]|uniref:DUF309 domain-containing protein n=1 Tax=Rummeliibacillus sp. NPDC094406 TaxID=3364511 RepID=UPI00381EC661
MHPMHHPLFIQFLTYFNGNQDYFECHEVLEEYWKEVAPRDKKHPLTGWIQLATGLYHWRRENFKGAHTILNKAERTLNASIYDSFLEEINTSNLLHQIHLTQEKVNNHEPYICWYIDIQSPDLKLKVEHSIATLPPSDTYFLQNKHMLRDRSNILLARQEKRRSRH